MHRPLFAALALATTAPAACETGARDSSPDQACSLTTPCAGWTTAWCEVGTMGGAEVPHGALVVSVVAHYSTGYQPWSQWSQSSEGVAFTCPAELDADQGNVLIYYFATE